MGVENYIFWSEIRSGFEEQGGTPHQEFPGVSPPPPPGLVATSRNFKKGDLATLGRPCRIGWENNEQTKLTMVPSQKPKELRPMGDPWGTISIRGSEELQDY